MVAGADDEFQMSQPQTISDIGRTYLRWSLTEGIGPLRFAKMVNFFGDAEKALTARPGDLAQIPGIGNSIAETAVRTRDQADVAGEIAAAEAHGVRIICREDADYPSGLKRIPDAPIVLYVRGELRDTDAVALAIVGSRRCTVYGSEQARRFGELLAGAGFTVVSGLARGIDAFAHHGAVDSGGRSIAVMGGPLTSVYPPENQALAEKLLDHGAWLSELPLRASVRAENFPSRNRIIAGMTLGTLVIEAAQRSGALITARLAVEYNREVFAVPGRVQDPMSFGTNGLIRDGGAKLVMTLEDVLDGLGEVGRSLQKSLLAEKSSGRVQDAANAPLFQNQTDKSAVPEKTLTPIEQRVLEVIGLDPILQEQVFSTVEFPPGEVLAAMTSLEIKALIKRLPGQLVVRRGRA